MKPVSVFKVCLKLSGFGYINAIACIPQAVICFYIRSPIYGFEVTFVILSHTEQKIWILSSCWKSSYSREQTYINYLGLSKLMSLSKIDNSKLTSWYIANMANSSPLLQGSSKTFK